MSQLADFFVVIMLAGAKDRGSGGGSARAES